MWSQTGRCNKPGCTFAHCREELRATSCFFKTKLCRFWQTGHCALGEKCRFAHSKDELHNEDDEGLLPLDPATSQVINLQSLIVDSVDKGTKLKSTQEAKDLQADMNSKFT